VMMFLAGEGVDRQIVERPRLGGWDQLWRQQWLSGSGFAALN